MAGVVAGHGAAPFSCIDRAPAKRKFHRISMAAASPDAGKDANPVLVSRRAAFSSLSLPFLQHLLPRQAAALIEADDDEELLEKAKGDRQKRLEKRGTLIGLKDETAYVQNAVYQLSKAGQALEKDDFAEASNILAAADWVAKTKAAVAKMSKDPDQQDQAEIFTSSLATLQTAVSKKDGDSAKLAFFTSASALEKWTSLTGLTEQIKGL